MTMGELSIYDPPATIKEAAAPPQPSKYSELMSTIGVYKSTVCDSVTSVRTTCQNTTDTVAHVIEPITRHIPVTSDSTKKVGIIGLCALSGLLQGRRKGRLQKYLYPLIATGGGCSACYPKQTYLTGSRVMTSALPFIALSGKATVEFGKSTVASVSALFPATPITEAVTLELSQPAESSIEAVIAEIISDHSPLDECPVEIPEEIPDLDISEMLIPEVPDLDSPLDLSHMSKEDSEEEIKFIEEVIGEALPIEELIVPEGSVEEIEEDLGLGDKEHDDMYSTRSSRSLYIVRT